MAFMTEPARAGYENYTGNEPNFLSDIGGTAILGGATVHGSGAFGNWMAKSRGEAGAGYGGFAYTQHSGVLSGGYRNRFVMAAKGGVAELFGFEATESIGELRKGLGRAAPTGIGAMDFSFAGWRNIQLRAMRAGKPIPQTMTAALKAEGMGLNLGFRILGTVAGVYSVYSGISEGYKQGGVWGAAKGGAKEVAMWGGRNMGATAFASVTGMSLGSVLLPAAIIAGAAYGGYRLGEYGRKQYKKVGKTEFAAPLVDPHGTGYTMRQRSLMAMQKSTINGRLAMGNEALLMHSPILR